MERRAQGSPFLCVTLCITATLRAGWSCMFLMVSSTDPQSVKTQDEVMFGFWWCNDVLSVAHLWVKNCKELLPSTYNPSRFDQPVQATQWLKNFKITNERFLSKVQLMWLLYNRAYGYVSVSDVFYFLFFCWIIVWLIYKPLQVLNINKKIVDYRTGHSLWQCCTQSFKCKK